MRILNVSNPARIKEAAFLELEAPNNGLDISGDLVLVAGGKQGLRIVDGSGRDGLRVIGR